MEAMACGVPVVTTAVSGITELVHHDENGLIVPPDDAGRLAAAISRVVNEPGLAGRLGESGRSTVATRFDAGIMAERMAALVAAAGATA
jgi:glycosyltransferase involved in cell wall biosynthesis